MSREGIPARHRARGVTHPHPPMLWSVLGGLMSMVGLLWLIAAFV